MSHALSTEPTNRREVLIRLRAQPPADAERVIHVVEQADGAVKQAFLPTALIAELPSNRIADLLRHAEIESIETDAIDESLWLKASPDWLTAVSVWNQHLRAAAGRTAAPDRPWDAPGFLPPDPPAETRERLRRREQELKSRDGQT
jgi:hypothetical protein